MASATIETPKRGRTRSRSPEAILTEQGFPKFEVVPLDLCFVDEDYQRPLTAFVKRIIDNYNPGLVGTFILSHRTEGEYAGRYALVDGQTRWAAMRTRDMTHAPALVHEGLSQAQEAKLFSDLQYERQNIASYYHYRADLVAQQPEALAIERIVRATEYETGVGVGTINAVVALRAVYRQGGDLLERVLTILREAWGDRQQPNSEILRGMAWFLRRNEDANDEKLARRLSVMSLDDMKVRAIAQRQAMGRGSHGAMFMGMALAHLYAGR